MISVTKSTLIRKIPLRLNLRRTLYLTFALHPGSSFANLAESLWMLH
jgi:hypothetical protein